ncbi:hypothetical protein MTR_2g083850 [Medicago truncatula]|uniref:DNA helicase Pif1-like 2B domain-containing protein n=1 Tax=Medicago truncatula TaxID=3880 RepID=G7IM70_MEDTR|nr:hypothetical protein MTR_2g083850 [Medicago truncatula]
MLLRNIDPRYGLCKGTRLFCCGLFKNTLNVEILTGSNVGKRICLPIIKLKTTGSSGLPFVLSRKQFPVTLSRGVSQNSTKILIKEVKIEGEDEDFTKNVVFKDILLSQS